MSNHNSTLTMIEAELDRLAKDRRAVDGKRLIAQAEVEAQQREMAVIDHQIRELQNSKACLEFDRAAAKMDAPTLGKGML